MALLKFILLKFLHFFAHKLAEGSCSISPVLSSLLSVLRKVSQSSQVQKLTPCRLSFR